MFSFEPTQLCHKASSRGSNGYYYTSMPCERRPMNFAPGFGIEKRIPKSKDCYLGQIGKLIDSKKVSSQYFSFILFFKWHCGDCIVQLQKKKVLYEDGQQSGSYLPCRKIHVKILLMWMLSTLYAVYIIVYLQDKDRFLFLENYEF